MIKSGKVHELSTQKGRERRGDITKKNNYERRRDITKKTRTGKADSCLKVKAGALLDFNLTLSRSFHDFLFLWKSDPQDSVEHYRRYFFALHLLGKYKTSPVRCV